jgi:endoglucanase
LTDKSRTRLVEVLSDLVALDAVAGREQPVVELLRDRLSAVCDECRVDRWGNIVATKRGQADGLRLLVGAHSDEIGFYVKSISPAGFLHVEPVGGIPTPIMPGRPVRVDGVPGVIGSPAWHLGKKAGALFVDVGADSEAHVAELGVEIGSPVALVSDLRRLGEHRVTGKAMDNRSACAVLVAVLEALSDQPHEATIVGVVTVQEEVGLRGARMVAEQVEVDAAVSIDVMVTGDTPDCDGLTDSTVRLGAGPVLSVYDQIEEAYAASLIGIIPHRRLNERFRTVAREAGIPLQLCALTGGGADGAAFHLARGGVPATQIGLPVRYSHSMVETVDLRDLARATDLLEQLVRRTGALDLGFL